MEEFLYVRRSGQHVAEHYRLDSRIGKGGQGDVWKAFDQKLERPVAIKFAAVSHAEDVEAGSIAVQRFRREMGTTARMGHPGVPYVYDAGYENGAYYIVMEYIDGVSLHEFMKEYGGLELPVAASIVVGLCDVLAAAHRVSIIHRDIKPENIMITRFGEIKVLDFGAASVPELGPRLTRGQSPGTPEYMAPELWSEGIPTPATDLYAAGCVLYEMLTGRSPYSPTANVPWALQHISVTPDSIDRILPDLPDDVVKIIEKLMAKNPANRFRSADELNLRVRPYLPKAGDRDPGVPGYPDPTRIFRKPYAPIETVILSSRSPKVSRNPVTPPRNDLRQGIHDAKSLLAEGNPVAVVDLIQPMLPDSIRYWGQVDPYVADLRNLFSTASCQLGFHHEALEGFENVLEHIEGYPGLHQQRTAALTGAELCREHMAAGIDS